MHAGCVIWCSASYLIVPFCHLVKEAHKGRLWRTLKVSITLVSTWYSTRGLGLEAWHHLLASRLAGVTNISSHDVTAIKKPSTYQWSIIWISWSSAKMKILPVIFMTLVALGLLIPACSGDGEGNDSGTSGAAAAMHSYLLTKWVYEVLTLSRACLNNWSMPDGRGFQAHRGWIQLAMEWMKLGSRRPRFVLDD